MDKTLPDQLIDIPKPSFSTLEIGTMSHNRTQLPDLFMFFWLYEVSLAERLLFPHDRQVGNLCKTHVFFCIWMLGWSVKPVD